jgi:hypothetical protein
MSRKTRMRQEQRRAASVDASTEDLDASTEDPDASTEDLDASTENDQSEDPYAKLQREYAAEKAANKANADALAAERTRVRELESESGRAAADVRQSHRAVFEQAITAAQFEAERAEMDYRAAFEAGDAGALAKAQRAITAAELKLARYNDGKDALARSEQDIQIQAKRPADDFEAQISNFSEPSKAWLRKRREVVSDPVLKKKALAAHNLAILEDITPDTPEYFEYLEDRLGFEDEGDARELGKPARPGRIEQRSYAAPPTRTSGRGANGAAHEITLTREQRSYARSCGMTDKEYADSLEQISSGKSHLRLTKDIR